MQRIEKTVFISYRRTNTSWALAIYQDLTKHGYDVFFDYNSIKSGDFAQIITQNVEGRAHFVVILTPSALERCNEPGDWLRREIELAMDTKRNIVPLFLEGFSFGTPSIAKHLTGKLATLKRYNGVSVPADYFDAAMNKLRQDRLNVALETVLHPISSNVQQKVRKQQRAANRVPEINESSLTASEWFERGINSENLEDQMYFYTKAIQLKAEYADAYNNRGIVRKTQGDLAGAISDYNEAIRLKADYPEPYNNRGNVRKAHGDLAGAIADYSEAIRLKADYAEAYNNRGNVRKAHGDLAGAIADYNEAIRLKAEYAEAYNNRGIARRAQGDIASAIADYNEAIRLKAEYADAHNNRGVARQAKGDLAGAIADYNEAIRLKADHIDAYYNRGLARKKEGDTLGAITDYQKYLDLGGGKRDGDQAEVEKIIEDLKDRYNQKS